MPRKLNETEIQAAIEIYCTHWKSAVLQMDDAVTRKDENRLDELDEEFDSFTTLLFQTLWLGIEKVHEITGQSILDVVEFDWSDYGG